MQLQAGPRAEFTDARLAVSEERETTMRCTKLESLLPFPVIAAKLQQRVGLRSRIDLERERSRFAAGDKRPVAVIKARRPVLKLRPIARGNAEEGFTWSVLGGTQCLPLDNSGNGTDR